MVDEIVRAAILGGTCGSRLINTTFLSLGISCTQFTSYQAKGGLEDEREREVSRRESSKRGRVADPFTWLCHFVLLIFRSIA